MYIQDAIALSLIDPTGKPRPGPTHIHPVKIRRKSWPVSRHVEIAWAKSKIWSYYDLTGRPGAWTPGYDDVTAHDWEAAI